MKAQAALAMMAIVTAIGVTQPQAAERIAKLTDPAVTGSTALAPRDLREKASLPPSVVRTGLSGLEQQRIRSSIRGHMQALGKRDAAGAYATLTPAIKDYYKNSNAFLAYLTAELKPLAYAKDFEFASIIRVATDAIQEVVLTGAEGREWIAQFKLQRQPDGRWAISQCLIEAAPGPQS